ncbi:MAG TPA: 3-phosphoshikimate 1-carboxyvinyltransferase [Gemmatimonas sp.]|uniref:3-phosphoshikimate 1-carboxyvinyltransferase n=1 Tax=Gemmatimonas sp. TaxID=1962908 RepID=UPI002EDAF2D3
MSKRQPLHVAGTIRAPGDKSISHRSLIFAALADGETRVRDILASADVHATASALRAMGVAIPALSADFVVRGGGIAALASPQAALDCANSGTTTRLLCGLVSGLPGRVARFEGDASLSRRPMRRVASPLTSMGARIEFEGAPGHDGLPMRVHGAQLRGTNYVSAHASAQVKGALLLAGLASGVEVIVEEPSRSRDHSERMLLARGVALEITERTVRLPANQQVTAADVVVPSDPSSATFFAALAAVADSGELRLENVCLNPTRTGAFDVLQRMGVSLSIADERLVGGELIGTLVVRPEALHGSVIQGAEIPRCIDELPMLACLASQADGETRIADAAELRVKESDRIRAVVENLRTLGVDAEELPDGMRITGNRTPLRGHVITHGDHRLAMAFGVLGAIPGNEITIDDPHCVDVSYPRFWEDLAQATGSAPSAAVASAASASAGSEALAATASAPLVIAIDGPAASGKSSTAQWVAQQLGVRHVDSGAFYRAITFLALETCGEPEAWQPEAVLANAARVSWRLTERSVLPLVDGIERDADLRDAPVTRQVSRIAQMTLVRSWVNDVVRSAGASVDVVVDGRDIGTTVFPDAQLKVFLIADSWERARRRLVQRLGRRPTDAEIANETEELVARDAKDATQSAAARDAITIDTTTVTQAEQVERIVALARATRDRIRRGS